MVRGLHLCQLNECNASRPDISLMKKVIKANLGNNGNYKIKKLVAHVICDFICLFQ